MSVTVHVRCPACDSVLKMQARPEALAGKAVRCPQCEHKFPVAAEDIRVVQPSAARPRQREAPKAEDSEELPELAPSPRARQAAARRAEKQAPTPKKKQKKRRTAAVGERTYGTAVLLWTTFGLAAGVVSVGVWCLVGMFSGYSLGFLAIAVGALVGVAVRFGAGPHEGVFPGLTAVLISVASIVVSRVLLTMLVFGHEWLPHAGAAAATTEQDVIAHVAHQVVIPEFRQQGKPFALPETAMEAESFPENPQPKDYHLPEVWAEAERRWRSWTPEEQAAFRQRMQDEEDGVDRESLIARVLDQEVAPAFTQQGKPIYNPNPADDDGSMKGQYAPEAWQEAERRWDAQTPAQQQAAISQVRAEAAEAEQVARHVGTLALFVIGIVSCFFPLNLVWMVLAGIMAYRLGSTWAVNP